MNVVMSPQKNPSLSRSCLIASLLSLPLTDTSTPFGIPLPVALRDLGPSILDRMLEVDPVQGAVVGEEDHDVSHSVRRGDEVLLRSPADPLLRLQVGVTELPHLLSNAKQRLVLGARLRRTEVTHRPESRRVLELPEVHLLLTFHEVDPPVDPQERLERRGQHLPPSRQSASSRRSPCRDHS